MVIIVFDLSTPRSWQLSLIGRLETRHPGQVRVRASSTGGRLPGAVDRLFTLEALLHRIARPGPMSAVDRRLFDPFLIDPSLVDEDGDIGGAITVDLSGGDQGQWQIVVDDQAGVAPDVALAAAAMARRAPEVALVAGRQPIASARPGTEAGGIALSSCEDWLFRLQTLVVAALAGARPVLGSLPDEADRSEPRRDPVEIERALKAIAAHGMRLLYRLLTRSPHWRIGWRRLDGPDVYDLRSIPPGWHDLPDDGLRFYADPFLVSREGVTAMFMEEFPHRLGRGVISVVRFDAGGPSGRPEPILDTGSHLSYPHVFEHAGALWMIPESCAARGIDLYRCTSFPSGWQHHARLIDDVVASDATLVQADGLLWLFATVRDEGGAFSDALHLWWAEKLDGPWTPHAGNPVLIDIAAARPAGAMVRRGDTLLRPVQDCRRGYGAALAIARITRLDRDGYSQQVETQLASGPNWTGRRLHTLNAGGGFEAIDGSAVMPRLRPGRHRAPRPHGAR